MKPEYLTASEDLLMCLVVSISPETDDSPPLSLMDRFLYMRLGETGPRERRRWGGFLMDTDMTGEERRGEEYKQE